MSNYTLAVAWSGKDALSDSDAAKVISGSDFNTEFTAVQTAVNTKADVNGSVSEAFSATTATAATNVTNALGQGQSWTDVKASRSKGVTYTNSTGKPIAVAISSEGGGTQGRITLTIGSVDVMLDGIDSSYSNNMGSVFGIVPNGTTYSATSDYSTFSLWTELR